MKHKRLKGSSSSSSHQLELGKKKGGDGFCKLQLQYCIGEHLRDVVGAAFVMAEKRVLYDATMEVVPSFLSAFIILYMDDDVLAACLVKGQSTLGQHPAGR